MIFLRKSIVSSQAVKSKSDKINKRILRDAKKRIKKGELADSHDLALYLPTIDNRYTQIKTDITNETRVFKYGEVRAAKMAETRELLEFFSQDDNELLRLYQIVSKKAEQAKRVDDLKQETLAPTDLKKLKTSFEVLELEEN